MPYLIKHPLGELICPHCNNNLEVEENWNYTYDSWDNYLDCPECGTTLKISKCTIPDYIIKGIVQTNYLGEKEIIEIVRPVIKLKEYILFAGNKKSTSGGFSDYLAAFNTIEEAKDYLVTIDKQLSTSGRALFDWAHIVNSSSLEIVEFAILSTQSDKHFIWFLP
jgi:hypothetical protein